ncbi:MAG: DUF7507 domain-containing protein [Candidatus Limnocylindrales bacterium]
MSPPLWRLLRRHDRTRRSRGQSLVELALIMPIFLLLIAAAIDFGRLFSAYIAIVNATKEGALYGATHPQCDTAAACPNPQNVAWHVQTETGNLKDAGGSLTPTISCRTGTASVGLIQCRDGATYHVGLDYRFRLITPILGSLLGNGITLHAESEATVINEVVDPKPGVSVTKKVYDPGKGEYRRTPVPNPKTGKLEYLEFATGDTVRFEITVRNTGGAALTDVVMTDVPDGLPSSCRIVKPIPIGGKVTCTYTKKLKDSDLDGESSNLLSDTVTLTAAGLSPVEDVATINVTAKPPELVVTKQVNVYRDVSPFGTDTHLIVFEGIKTKPTVWYRIMVKNVGGLTATGFTVRDSFNSGSSGDCKSPPSTLDPGDSYVCYYPRTFSGTGSFDNTATADSRETNPVSAHAKVDVGSCPGSSSAVVPNLVEEPSGAARTVAEARALWFSSGFSGPFDPAAGSNGDRVTGQNRDPFDCRAITTSVRVDHR